MTNNHVSNLVMVHNGDMKATTMWILMGLNGIEWDVYIYVYIHIVYMHTYMSDVQRGCVFLKYHADLSWKVVGCR